MPAWQQALQAVHLPLYDVHWTPAVVVQKGDGKKDDGTIRVGLPDGRIVPLTGLSDAIRRSLSLYDVVYVNVVESRRSEVARPRSTPEAIPSSPKTQAVTSSGQAQLRVRPTVQGAALVLENKTGRILAMAGSFSYPLSQLNRTSQTQRQPGSAIKPMTYLTALQKGLQPNTLVLNDPITLPPIGSATDGRIIRDFGSPARPEDYWSPRNADYARAASSRCGAAWRIRSTSSPRICSTAASTPIRRRVSTMFARPPWRRKSTPNACAIIRSCSARSRCR